MTRFFIYMYFINNSRGSLAILVFLIIWNSGYRPAFETLNRQIQRWSVRPGGDSGKYDGGKDLRSTAISIQIREYGNGLREELSSTPSTLTTSSMYTSVRSKVLVLKDAS
jgi:hypothetical protein